MSFSFLVMLYASYASIGGAIKFLDDVHDRNWFFRGRTPICWCLTTGIAVLSGIWMTIDTYSAALVLALTISLSLVWKVDNRYFVTIPLLTLLVAFLFGFHWSFLFPSLTTLIILIPTFAIDELLHSLARFTRYSWAQWMLKRRLWAKAMVIILPYYFLFTFSHALAFWCFDITYDIIGLITARRVPAHTHLSSSQITHNHR